MEYIENDHSHRYAMFVAEQRSNINNIKEELSEMSTIEELETYKNSLRPHGVLNFLRYIVSDKMDLRMCAVNEMIKDKKEEAETLEEAVKSDNDTESILSH